MSRSRLDPLALPPSLVLPPLNGSKPKRGLAPKGKGTPAPAAPRAMRRDDKLAVVVASAAICTTVTFSILLNVRAFTAVTWDPLAVACGIAIPLWCVALTYLAHHLHTTGEQTGARIATALGAYLLAIAALIVSMPHLVAGFEAWGLACYEAWALAGVCDLTQVVAKAAIIFCVRKGE